MTPGDHPRWLEPLAAAAALLVALGIAVGVILLALGHPPSSGQWTVLELSLIGVVVAAVGYGTMRRRLAGALRRRLEGDRLTPQQLLRSVSSGFSRAIPLDEALLRLIESLRDSLGLAAAEIWTVGDRELTLAVGDPRRTVPAAIGLDETVRATLSHGEARGEQWARESLPALLSGPDAAPRAIVPIVHSGELLGVLIAGRTASAGPLSESAVELLGEIGRQLALVLHNLRLDAALEASYEELRASRTRIVAAADAERRKIERDLHDGAQQRLLTLAMRLATARAGSAAERETALAQAAGDLQAAISELRSLARGIYPPLLTENGLPAALTAVARAAPLPVDVELELGRRQPPATEAAIYFCCLEALTNVSRHAGPGTRARVRVWDAGDQLRFEVSDDGRGTQGGPGDAAGGTGLVSIRDRIGAVGGTVQLGAIASGGWSVRGSVPVPGAGLSGPSRPGTSAPPSPGG